MSKSIKSYPKEFQNAVIKRREASGTLGLGYWAARDAIKKTTENKQNSIGHQYSGQCRGLMSLEPEFDSPMPYYLTNWKNVV